jgi:hypothetical protein
MSPGLGMVARSHPFAFSGGRTALVAFDELLTAAHGDERQTEQAEADGRGVSLRVEGPPGVDGAHDDRGTECGASHTEHEIRERTSVGTGVPDGFFGA